MTILTQNQTNKPTSDPRGMAAVLRNERGLKAIRLKTAQIQLAQDILTQILPTKILGHCFVGHVDDKTLTIFSDSAVWATQLRYQQGEMVSAFRQHTGFRALNRIKIKIKPPTNKPPKRLKQAISLSSKVSRLLQSTAATIRHPSLKKALLKLAEKPDQEA